VNGVRDALNQNVCSSANTVLGKEIDNNHSMGENAGCKLDLVAVYLSDPAVQPSQQTTSLLPALPSLASGVLWLACFVQALWLALAVEDNFETD
jgi:hypothetical protein